MGYFENLPQDPNVTPEQREQWKKEVDDVMFPMIRNIIFAILGIALLLTVLAEMLRSNG